MTKASVFDAEWWRGLATRLDMPAAPARSPWGLAIGHGTPSQAPVETGVVGSIDSTLALDLAGAGFDFTDTGTAWRLAVPDPASVDATLARLAHWLRAAGIASAWRDELLDVRDAEGHLVGAIERAAVRPLGIATRAVHLVVSDPDGKVWIQQRAFDKAVDPGMWDTTMGGLTAAGEDTAETLARETWEEAGLRLADLGPARPFGGFTVRRPLPDGYMVEHIEMFEALAGADLVPRNQDGEVAGFAVVGREALAARLRAGEFTLEAAMVLTRWLEARD